MLKIMARQNTGEIDQEISLMKKLLALTVVIFFLSLGTAPSEAVICVDCAAYENMALCVGTDTVGAEWCEEVVRCRNGKCLEYCLLHGGCVGQV